MSKVRPTGITAVRSQKLLKITWNDGHESAYPYAGLRAECPCAECRGGHENMGQPADPRIVRDAPDEGVIIKNIEPAGNYAITFRWSDGHWAGIYTWDYLRQACPCSECLPD
ncbi:MAG: DUF971 domain-containing protein [Chloroflexi bacterium]|nr:DUF971 domain-containing protein [Chloroflexota bacterium]